MRRRKSSTHHVIDVRLFDIPQAPQNCTKHCETSSDTVNKQLTIVGRSPSFLQKMSANNIAGRFMTPFFTIPIRTLERLAAFRAYLLCSLIDHHLECLSEDYLPVKMRCVCLSCVSIHPSFHPIQPSICSYTFFVGLFIPVFLSSSYLYTISFV